LRSSDITAVVAVMSVHPTSAKRTAWQLLGSAAKACGANRAEDKPTESEAKQNKGREKRRMKTPENSEKNHNGEGVTI
jgi:hypothetical protein